MASVISGLIESFFRTNTTTSDNLVELLSSFFPPKETERAQLPSATLSLPEKLFDLYHSLQLFLASRSSIENTSLLLATSLFTFLLMSWSSRLGQWSGRFSPFGRSPTTEGAPTVDDSDYSYITSEDLNRGDYDQRQGPPRDTDVLVLKNKRSSYPVHFPAYSVDRGELTIGDVKQSAAKKMGADVRRIKLFYRGKNLKDDGRICRAEGLREGAEIMCVVAEGQMDSQDESESDEIGTGADGDSPNLDGQKRKRNRNRNKKKKHKKPAEPAESLGVPPAETSRAPSPKIPSPATPMDKLNAINAKLQEILPMCDEFYAHPPSEPAKKEFEHKKLSETVLAQVLLKLDAVETEDPETRARRKELVKQAQSVLSDLDRSMK